MRRPGGFLSVGFVGATGWSPLLACIFILVLLPAPAAAGTPLETAARAWCDAHRATYDPAVSRGARRWLIDRSPLGLRHHLQEEGVFDYPVVSVPLADPDYARLLEQAGTALERLRGFEGCRIGAAEHAGPAGAGYRGAVVCVRRLLPFSIRRNEREMAVSLTEGAGQPVKVEVYLGTPDLEVSRHDLAPGRELRLPDGSGGLRCGRYTLEVVADDPAAGPQVAALAQLEIRTGCRRRPVEASFIAADAGLARLVNRLRTGAGRPVLRELARLNAAASERAARMRSEDRLGHVPSSGRTASRAVRESGTEFGRVAELIASGDDDRQAYLALVESPVHLAGLLDPGFVWYGAAGDGGYYSLILAEMAGPAERTQAIEQIDRADRSRKRQSRPPLVEDRSLARLARLCAEEECPVNPCQAETGIGACLLLLPCDPGALETIDPRFARIGLYRQQQGGTCRAWTVVR